jgi:hypothetical protein
MALAQTNRAVGSHDMNEHSSRSHSILTLVCRGKNRIDGTTTFGNYGNLFKKSLKGRDAWFPWRFKVLGIIMQM